MVECIVLAFGNRHYNVFCFERRARERRGFVVLSVYQVLRFPVDARW
jgi:hypothetical protein